MPAAATLDTKLDQSFLDALAKFKALRAASILQPVEPDGTDAQPNEPTTVEQITFTNYDPRIYDGLGEIQWTADKICSACGHTDFHTHTAWYDGCYREMPECDKCDTPVLGLPVDETARQLVLANRAGRRGHETL